MQIELRVEQYPLIACDMLAFPIFEDETDNSTALEPLDRITNGVLKAVLSSGEFRPELHKSLKIYRPTGIQARYLLLVGAGKKAAFEPSKLREIAGVAVRNARSSSCKTVAFMCRGVHPAGIAASAEPAIAISAPK